MINLNLNYYQRVVLWNLVGNHQAASLKEAAVYLRIIEKVRLNDEEAMTTEFLSAGQGQFTWKLPFPGYGSKTVELENEEHAALVKAMESAQPVRVGDAEWMIKMTEEKAETVKSQA